MENILTRFSHFMVALAGLAMIGFGIYIHFHTEFIQRMLQHNKALPFKIVHQYIGDYGVIGLCIIIGIVVTFFGARSCIENEKF